MTDNDLQRYFYLLVLVNLLILKQLSYNFILISIQNLPFQPFKIYIPIVRQMDK